MKSLLTKAAKNVGPEQALEGLKILIQAQAENHKVTQIEETNRLRITKNAEVQIAAIQAQKELVQSYLQQQFSERRLVIDNLFNALDKGIEQNKPELIAQCIGSIVDIAKESPLKSAMQLIQDIKDDSVKRIEF